MTESAYSQQVRVRALHRDPLRARDQSGQVRGRARQCVGARSAHGGSQMRPECAPRVLATEIACVLVCFMKHSISKAEHQHGLCSEAESLRDVCCP